MSEPDELFTVRTLFWLGSYQTCINEATSNKQIPASCNNERKEYLYRSFLALGQGDVVTSEIKDTPNTPTGLRSILYFAQYLEARASGADKKDLALKVMGLVGSDAGESAINKTAQVIAATVCIYEDNIKEAFSILKNGSSLEQHALLVNMYIKVDRIDLAQKQLKVMKELDEDSTMTMLTMATIYTCLGKEKATEAVYIYEELIDKYGSSSSLLNGLACGKMQIGAFDEAESSLKEALTKTPNDADTLANLITVSYHMQQPGDVINRYMSQLKSKHPNHALALSIGTFDSAFDRVASALG